MRLLLDESVPATLRRHLPSHEVRTAVEMGWSGVRNGRLLQLAAGSFDALVTVDKNMRFQQNLSDLPIAVVILDTLSNELQFLMPLVPRLERALAQLAPKTFVLVRHDA